jgi:FAD/FMN-containing dehydrogenase/Fe-S oxidoreductase
VSGARWTHPAVAQWRADNGAGEVDAESLEQELKRTLDGEVRFDRGSRAIYSHDSSNYRAAPIGVVVPRTLDDVEAAHAACREHGAPIVNRGCATSLSGETTNFGLVMDHSKYLRDIVEIDPDRRLARVMPGVIRDQLSNLTEADHHLTFAPDTSTHKYATFGGMIGNNSCGVHSVMAGRTSDNVKELELLTYDGLRLRVGRTTEEELERIIAGGGRKAELYGAMRDLRDRYADRIREKYPDIPRRVSGYNLDELLPEKGFNVARAIVGSEGTLATVLEATVRLVYSPPYRTTLVLGYPEIFDAADHVMEVLEYGPTGLEALDARLVDNMITLGTHAGDAPMLPDGGGWLLAEFAGDSRDDADSRAQDCMARLRKEGHPLAMKLFDDVEDEHTIWEIREAGLGATAYVPMQRDAWPGWEDAAVNPARLGDYLREFKRLLSDHDYEAALYGHFGDGCVHCRINFDLRSAGGLRTWRSFLDEAAELCLKYDGSLSGEHGDGQQRAELLPKMFGDELVGAFREFKALWDPDGRMNPHKVVDPYPILSNLKLGADYAPPTVETHFAYPADGGSFAHAALRCVGAGLCRDTESGTMCPSYMVTRDEMHTTRGRSRMLFEMLQGDLVEDGFRSKAVHEALDLCLSCKGCKGDCPVSVDMATYKAEFLSKHYKRRLRPPAAYTMGLIMLHARAASKAPRLANLVTHTPGLRQLVQRLGGISTKRAMPPFAHQTFVDWFGARGEVNPGAAPVMLFPDTFNNFLHPEPMKATVDVLEAAGFRVLVPERQLCCGRPLYDYGMLDLARRFWKRTLKTLEPHIRDGVPVVGVEPSCVASFRDELPNLMPHDQDALRLSLQTLTLAEFLDRHAEDWAMPRLDRRAVVHGHCHQEATMGMDGEQSVYRRMGLDFEVLDSGCCGLAGSFGFERAHDEISRAIGEHRLMPMVRAAPRDTLVIGDGFSCKTQVEHLTERRPLHTAQVIKMALDHGPDGVSGNFPERAYPDVVLG